MQAFEIPSIWIKNAYYEVYKCYVMMVKMFKFWFLTDMNVFICGLTCMQYKFYVDGKWGYDESEHHVTGDWDYEHGTSVYGWHGCW